MNRVQEVKKVYPEYADQAMKIADPIHKHKYLMWIAIQLSNKHTPEDVKSTVNAFHKEAKLKRLKETDIYNYKDLKTLEDEIKDLALSKRQVEIYSKEMGAVKIYSDDICTLVRMNSKDAMLYYGKATRWCVAMEKENYWDDYSTSGNVFYVLIDKKHNIKYAIQKSGFLDVIVWTENDKEININDWVKKNRQFDPAVFACLHDREESMLYRIKRRETTRTEVMEWLKYQHKSTIKYIENNVSIAGYYLIDNELPITNETINNLSDLPFADISVMATENATFVAGVVVWLSEHPKVKVKYLRLKLGNLIPNPEIILGEDDSNFIKMKKDPAIAEKLLHSSKSEIWKKALELASPAVILTLLPTIKQKSKRNSFIARLKQRTNYGLLIGFLSSNGIAIPDDIWLAKAKNQSDEYDEDESNYESEDEDDEYDEDDEE